jgi:hypothetical protein
MTSWRISSEQDNSRAWYSSSLEDDELRCSSPIKPGDQIKDLHDEVVRSVVEARPRSDGTFKLKMKRNVDGGDTVTTTLKYRMVVDPIDEEGSSC